MSGGQSGGGHAPCGACSTDIRGLGVTLGGRVILADVNLHLHCGELAALVGLNGAGKTTLLRAVLGEIPHAGSIAFMDHDGRAMRPRIGYVPQRLEFDPGLPLTVEDLFALALDGRSACFGASARVRRQCGESLEAVEAGHLEKRRLGALSGGELQRVLLALSLAPVPNVLLLDEPLSGIDLAGRRMFYATVAKLRRMYDIAVVLVSHDLAAMVEVADRMIFLDGGVVCDAPPAEVWRDGRVRAAFGLDVGAAA